MASLYIGPADAVLRGQLPLGAGTPAIEAVALLNDVHFPLRQALLYQLPEPGVGILGVQRLHHGVLYSHHVQKEQAVAILVSFQRIGEGYFPLKLSLGTEMHKDLIFDASRRIGGQPGPLLRVVTGDPFDQSDGANGNQVLLVSGLGVILLGRVKQKEEFSRSKTTP